MLRKGKQVQTRELAEPATKDEARATLNTIQARLDALAKRVAVQERGSVGR